MVTVAFWMIILRQVCDALERFQGSPKPSTSSASVGAHSTGVFFFMCFFVNNQYRHTVDGGVGRICFFLCVVMFTKVLKSIGDYELIVGKTS